jgi:hypothetical protein
MGLINTGGYKISLLFIGISVSISPVPLGRGSYFLTTPSCIIKAYTPNE